LISPCKEIYWVGAHRVKVRDWFIVKCVKAMLELVGDKGTGYRVSPAVERYERETYKSGEGFVDEEPSRLLPGGIIDGCS
jgi:hypothetical protein